MGKQHSKSIQEPQKQQVTTAQPRGQSQYQPQSQTQSQQVVKQSEGWEKKIKSVPIVKIEKSLLTETHNVQITISKPEKHEGGFFSSDYITYLVETQPLGFQVKRRYSDFEWLRGILLSFFPGSMIPPIPEKNFGDRLHEEFINKRMRYLEVINLTLTLINS